MKDTKKPSEVNGNEDLGLGEKNFSQLMKFKEMVKDVVDPSYLWHEDRQLAKYCIARKWDLKKAEAMFRHSMATREKYRLDNILEEYQPPEVITKYLTGGIGCLDKEGCPVRIERFGYLDTKGIYYSCRRIDLEKFKLYEQEEVNNVMKDQTKKLGRRVDKIVVILDLEQIQTKHLWRPGLKMYLHLVEMLEDTYPEFVKHLIVINAPKLFPIFFKVCKPLISEDMRKKLAVYGANYKPQLLSLIDENELPAFLGGKQTGPNGDIYCKHKIRAGGPVPESYYLKDAVDTSEFESTKIAPGNKVVLKVEVDRPNCVISWEFFTEEKDLGFGLGFIPEGSEEQQTLLPTERVQCHMVPEDGTHNCEELGTYIVKFDNSYSWTTSKHLFYNVDVLVEDDSLVEEVKEFST